MATWTPLLRSHNKQQKTSATIFTFTAQCPKLLDLASWRELKDSTVNCKHTLYYLAHPEARRDNLFPCVDPGQQFTVPGARNMQNQRESRYGSIRNPLYKSRQWIFTVNGSVLSSSCSLLLNSRPVQLGNSSNCSCAAKTYVLGLTGANVFSDVWKCSYGAAQLIAVELKLQFEWL